MEILSHLDHKQNQSKAFVLEILAAAPSSPINGQAYYDSVLHQVRAYINGSWVDLGATGGGGGSSDIPVLSKTANYTVSTSDSGGVILCNASGGAFTITLFAAASNSGKNIRIKKTDSSSNKVTIDANASELIDDATTYQLEFNDEFVHLAADGTGWRIIAE